MISGTTTMVIANSFSMVVYALIAVWYVYPRLKIRSKFEMFLPLIWIHVFRNVGMMGLAPGIAFPDAPISAYAQMAFGDLIAASLALITIYLIRSKSSLTLVALWAFNIFGFLDLVHAASIAMQYDLANQPMGPTWLIAVFYVPALIVSHIMIFIMLLKRDRS